MRHLILAAAVVFSGVAAAPTAAADPTEAPAPSTSAAPAPSTDATPATAAPAESSESAPASPAEPSPSAPASPAEPSPSGSSGTPAGAHQITYTVTTTSDLTANIYYVVGDPPDQAAANKPEYMPMARTQIGPGSPWTVQTSLNDPNKWAFVSASGGLRVNPEFRCEIAVDGKVVVSQQGGSGVQCALRPW